MSGERFSPSKAERLSGVRFTDKHERGDMQVRGSHRGKPWDFGGASLDFSDRRYWSDPDLTEWLDLAEPMVEACRKAGAEAEDMYMSLLLRYRGDCGMEFTPECLARLAGLGITVTLDCWVDETLPDEEEVLETVE